MSAKDNLQGQLFDPATTRAQTPGERSFDEWEAQPGVAYHGSFRDDWHHAPTAHYGTKGLATHHIERQGDWLASSAHARAKLYNPSISEDAVYDDDLEDEATHIEGRVYARKMPSSVRATSDMGANSSDLAYRMNTEEYWDIPGSIKDSSSPVAKQAAESYEYDDTVKMPKVFEDNADFMRNGNSPDSYKGGALSYENNIEPDPYTHRSDTTSYVAPSHAVSSWESDVMSDPHASPLKKDFAKRRIRDGREGQVPLSSAPEQVGTEHTLPFTQGGGGHRPIRILPGAQRGSLRKSIEPD